MSKLYRSPKNQRGMLLQDFSPWMIDALKKHLAEGHSVISFHGRYNISQTNWHQWIKEVPELAEMNRIYKKKKLSERGFVTKLTP